MRVPQAPPRPPCPPTPPCDVLFPGQPGRWGMIFYVVFCLAALAYAITHEGRMGRSGDGCSCGRSLSGER